MVLTNGQLGEVVIYVLRPPPGKENDQQMLLCGNGEQHEIGEKEDQAVEVDCRGGDEGICLLQDRVFQVSFFPFFWTFWEHK
jgi:hypothetical protein